MTAKYEKMFAIVTDDQTVKEGDTVLVTLANGINTKPAVLGKFLYENPFKLRFFAQPLNRGTTNAMGKL